MAKDNPVPETPYQRAERLLNLNQNALKRADDIIDRAIVTLSGLYDSSEMGAEDHILLHAVITDLFEQRKSRKARQTWK
jgi:hypothetical protein